MYNKKNLRCLLDHLVVVQGNLDQDLDHSHLRTSMFSFVSQLLVPLLGLFLFEVDVPKK